MAAAYPYSGANARKRIWDGVTEVDSHKTIGFAEADGKESDKGFWRAKIVARGARSLRRVKNR